MAKSDSVYLMGDDTAGRRPPHHPRRQADQTYVSKWYAPFVAMAVAMGVFLVLFIVFAALYGEKIKTLPTYRTQ